MAGRRRIGGAALVLAIGAAALGLARALNDESRSGEYPANLVRFQEDKRASLSTIQKDAVGSTTDEVGAREVRDGDAAGLSPGVRALLRALADGDAGVRRAAAEGLGRHKHPSVVEALAGALEDGDAAVRRSAANTLGQLGDPAAAPALARHVAGEAWVAGPDGPIVTAGGERFPPYDSHGEGSKDAALQALAKLAPGEVTGALAAALEAKDPRVRSWAAKRLAAQKGERKDRSKGRAGGDTPGQVPSDLAPAVRSLLQALADESVEIRLAAARSLAKHRHHAAVQALALALEDEDGRVRREAANSLGKLGDPAAVPALMRRVADEAWVAGPPRSGGTIVIGDATPAYDGVPRLGSKVAALQALRKLAPEKATEALAEAMASKNGEVKRWATYQMADQNAHKVKPPTRTRRH